MLLNVGGTLNTDTHKASVCLNEHADLWMPLVPTNYLVIYKVYTDLGGIKQHNITEQNIILLR